MSALAKEYDVVILGGGTGGYVAAIRAAQLGLKTAIVEKNKLGGTCLHAGCIPTKALLRSAEVFAQSKQADIFGVELENVKVDFSKVQARKQAVVEQLYKGVQHLMQKGKIDVYNGHGRKSQLNLFRGLLQAGAQFLRQVDRHSGGSRGKVQVLQKYSSCTMEHYLGAHRVNGAPCQGKRMKSRSQLAKSIERLCAVPALAAHIGGMAQRDAVLAYRVKDEDLFRSVPMEIEKTERVWLE